MAAQLHAQRCVAASDMKKWQLAINMQSL